MKPQPPLFSHAPAQIAADTWLIQHFHGEQVCDRILPIHSVVVLGAEPLLVDTGAASNREQWQEDVFGLVDPGDVRWVFLSHDDVDHHGNLEPVLDRCPRATLLVSRQLASRLALELTVPRERCAFLEDGESLVAGDRRLLALRPPVFDAPTTRGLLDEETGVYWAADAWGTLLSDAVSDAADLDQAAWTAGMAAFARATAPWLDSVDPSRWAGTVERVAALRPTVIASAHGPVISGERVATALDVLRGLVAAGGASGESGGVDAVAQPALR